MISLYANIGGSQKTISSAYANIGGTRKQIYPSDITYTYIWAKYNSVSSTSNNETTTAYTIQSLDPNICVWKVSSYSFSGTKFIIDSSSFYGYVENLSSIGIITFYIQGSPDVGVSSIYNLYKGPATVSYAGEVEIGENNYENRYSISCYEVSVTTTTTYSQGSTYYGTVTSTSSSSYPSNGRHSDGYWYIYQGRS